MHKIILVDDEDEVREGIKCKTPWKACGFELVGDFDNGRDALEAMERLKPDAVITDICMPYMDGLDLTRGIREHYRGVKVVIVTGFENFEYAQQAIRLQVTDYLLKPLNLEEFTMFLEKLGGELEEERMRREDFSSLRSRLHESLPHLKERFLEKLAASGAASSDTEQRLLELGVSFTGPQYMALIGEIDEGAPPELKPSETEMQLLQYGLFNIMQEIVEQENGGGVFRTFDGKTAAFLSGEPHGLELLSQKLAGQIRDSAEKYMRLSVSVGIGRPCGSLKDLTVSYREAVSALDYRFLFGAGSTLSIQDMEFGRRITELPGSEEWDKRLISAMRSGSRSRVSDELAQGFARLKDTTMIPTEMSYQSARRLIAALRSWIAETGLEEPAALGDDTSASIPTLRSLQELQEWLEATCHRILDQLSATRTDVMRSRMLLAEQFIRENYRNENLSLSDCCRHSFMSISYFSALFKQHTGETFVEYLTRMRLDNARELLTLTSHKTYEIAHRVGYGDPHYFSVIFKRHTGKTPKEYRASKKGNS